MQKMEGGVLPVTEFPHDNDKVKEGNVHRQIEHGASTSISYITHALVHGRSSQRLYLSEHALSEQIEFIEGSRCSRCIDVHTP